MAPSCPTGDARAARPPAPARARRGRGARRATARGRHRHIPRRPATPDEDAREARFEAWVESALERTDPVMAWLGVLFALVVGYELAVELGPTSRRVLTAVGWVVWGVFLIEFLAHVYVAPRRLRYVRRHWIRVLALVIPTLRALRFVRLLRLGRALPAARVVTSSYRVAGTARRLLQSRLGYLGAVSVVVTIALAELAYLFERDRPDGIFGSFGDALLWAAGVVIAATGEPVPNSLGAHLAMLAGFAWAVVVFATLAGSLGAFFVDQRRERAELETPPTDPPG